jgi:hypothetical protein
MLSFMVLSSLCVYLYLNVINKIKKLLNTKNTKTLIMVHIAFDISQSMKKEFKVLCAEHGDEMSTILRKAVEDYIASKKTHIVKA